MQHLRVETGRIVLIFVLKLFLTPLFIGSATLAGRRWGPAVNGLLVGLPLTTGPISFILAHEYGLAFAANVAAGNLAGQISMCVFCLTYSLAAQKRGWLASAFTAVAAFLLTTALLNRFTWQRLPAFFALLLVIALVERLIPRQPFSTTTSTPPRWDLPARILVATSFVILLTTFANVLGPQLSGLISTFPIFGVVFATFTHSQQGAAAVSKLLRGIVLSSVAYAFFFLIVGTWLTHWGIALTYTVALLVTVGISGIFYFATRHDGVQGIQE
jgi:hypothetical protein